MKWAGTRAGRYQPIRPVMTQPIVGVILNRCVTVSAFRSLSFRVDERVWIARNGGDWDQPGLFSG